jgi:photosystem II stability/assembly factor-like uncharacterized protein
MCMYACILCAGWLYRTRHAMGASVFRLRIPALEHFVVVCDAETARTILMDAHAEKPRMYKPMVQITGGIETIFTKKTYGEGWEHARKSSAHAFTSARIASNMGASAPHLADLVRGNFRGRAWAVCVLARPPAPAPAPVPAPQ